MPPRASRRCAPAARRPRSAIARRCASRTTTRRASRSPCCSATSSRRRCSAPRPASGRGRSAPTSACTPCGCAAAAKRGCRRTTRSPRASPRSTARSDGARRTSGRTSEMRARYDVVIEQPEDAPRRRSRPVMRAVRCAALLAALLCALPALAHRLSPAFFGLTETAPNVVRRAVEGVDLGRPRGRARAASAGRLLADAKPCGPTSSTTCGCSTAHARVPERPRRPSVHGERPGADADRRAAARRLSGRHSSNQRLTPDAPTVVDPRAAERVRSRAHVSRARRRAHPARHRSFAVRARAAAARERRRPPRRDGHGVHGRAQHHARRGDARFRARAFGARRSRSSRSASCFSRRSSRGGAPSAAAPTTTRRI